VLFHLLTGRPPFEGEGMGDIIAAHIREPAPVPSSRAPEIAPVIDQLVLRCLAKAPAERYPTMGELAGAIGQILPYLASPAAHTQWAYAYPGAPSPTPAPPYASGQQPPYASGQQPPYASGQQPPYGSRPGTPVPSPGGQGMTPVPPPGYPPMPTPAPPYASASGQQPPYASGQQPPYGSGQHPPLPTTLGSSHGQVAGGPRARSLAWVLAGVLLVGGAGAAIAVVAMRGRDVRAAGSGGGAGSGAPSAAPDAVQANPPLSPADAAIAVAAVPDAPPMPPADAAAADAPPVADAPPSDAGKRPPRPPPRVPHAGSGTPPGCDRSIDTDCDGIPDVR
jgi:serine/threonine-protein kinase